MRKAYLLLGLMFFALSVGFAGAITTTVTTTVPPLSASFSVNKTYVTEGQPVLAAATWSGGYKPYSFVWSTGLSPSCQQDNMVVNGTYNDSSNVSVSGKIYPSFLMGPNAQFSYNPYYCGVVEDSMGNIAYTNAVSISVSPPLTNQMNNASLAASPRSVPAGGDVSLSLQWTGGVSPYYIGVTWGLDPACSTGLFYKGYNVTLNSVGIVYVPTLPAGFSTSYSPSGYPPQVYYCTSVYDSQGHHFLLDSLPVTLTAPANITNGTLSSSVSFSVNKTYVTFGQLVSDTVKLSGGVPPYTVTWYTGESPSCQQDTEEIVAPTPGYTTSNITGTFYPSFYFGSGGAFSGSPYYCAKVVDSNGAVAYTNAVSISVNPPPTGQIYNAVTSASPTSVVAGKNVSLTVSWTGGDSQQYAENFVYLSWGPTPACNTGGFINTYNASGSPVYISTSSLPYGFSPASYPAQIYYCAQVIDFEGHIVNTTVAAVTLTSPAATTTVTTTVPPVTSECVALSGFYCDNVAYYNDMLSLTFGQASGTNWGVTKLFFVPFGSTFSLGEPNVTLAPSLASGATASTSVYLAPMSAGAWQGYVYAYYLIGSTYYTTQVATLLVIGPTTITTTVSSTVTTTVSTSSTTTVPANMQGLTCPNGGKPTTVSAEPLGNPGGTGPFEQLDLSISAHPEIMAYRIQWFGGSWSQWYIPGQNDIDTLKLNLDGTQRRMWAYFDDHVHQYMTCSAPNPADGAVINSTANVSAGTPAGINATLYAPSMVLSGLIVDAAVQVYGGTPPYQVSFKYGSSPTCSEDQFTGMSGSTGSSSSWLDYQQATESTEPSGYYCAEVTDLAGHSAFTNAVYVTMATETSTTVSTTTIPGNGYAQSWPITVHKGWNIMPFYGVDTTDFSSSCHVSMQQMSNSTYIYDSLDNSYMSAADAASQSSAAAWWASSIRYMSDWTGWYYSPTDCQTSFNVSSLSSYYPQPTLLTSGWNFMTVLPWMLNQTYAGMFANCSVQKVYGWDGASQAWSSRYANVSAYMVGQGLASSYGQEVSAGQVGTTLLLYTSAACSLSQSGSGGPAPPPPPSSLKT